MVKLYEQWLQAIASAERETRKVAIMFTAKEALWRAGHITKDAYDRATKNAEAKQTAANMREWRLAEQIAEARSNTLVGAIVKLRVAKYYDDVHGNSACDDPIIKAAFLSTLADLERMGRSTAS